MIYFIKDSEGRIKIGTSCNPWTRLNGLATGAADALTLLAVMDGDRTVERELHKRFSSHRIGREWFRSVPEILALVECAKMEFPQHRREELPQPERRSVEAELAAIRQDGPHWLLEMELGMQLEMRHRRGLPSPGNVAELLDDTNIGAEIRAMTQRLDYLCAVIEFRRRHGYPVEGMRFTPQVTAESSATQDIEALGRAINGVPVVRADAAE